jgi:gamma-glutamylputrescine oxidase
MTHTPYPQSYYAASANPVPARPELQGEVQTDVCVIGAGYTGLSTALFLLENGFKVTVLEAAGVGFGASGRNGGQIVNSYSRDIDVIERTVGAQQAQLLGRMAFEGGRILRERIATYDIQCDLKDGGVFAALTSKQMGHLEAQKRLWERYGHTQLELLDGKRIREVVASENYIGGLLDMSGGHIHPLNLALGEAAAVESLGGTIYEHSPALRIERGANPVVHTPQGRVKAKFLVVAGNAYLGDLVPELAAKSMPCGTQVVATEPLSDALANSLLPQDYCVEDCNYLLDYYRLTADKRLIFGGGVVYGARDPANIEALIRPNIVKAFPQLKEVKIDYAWTGNFSLTLSRLPQMGRLGDNIYYSQGCSGHGVTYTHLAGKVLAEAIRGQAERFDAFASLPHYPFPGGQVLRVPFTALGAWYYSLRDKLGF